RTTDETVLLTPLILRTLSLSTLRNSRMLSTFNMQTISYSPVTSYTSVTSGSLTRLWVTFSSSLDSTNRFRKTLTSLAIVDKSRKGFVYHCKDRPIKPDLKTNRARNSKGLTSQQLSKHHKGNPHGAEKSPVSSAGHLPRFLLGNLGFHRDEGEFT